MPALRVPNHAVDGSCDGEDRPTDAQSSRLLLAGLAANCQRMPELLIGWARLLERRFRDPRVAR